MNHLLELSQHLSVVMEEVVKLPTLKTELNLSSNKYKDLQMTPLCSLSARLQRASITVAGVLQQSLHLSPLEAIVEMLFFQLSPRESQDFSQTLGRKRKFTLI